MLLKLEKKLLSMIDEDAKNFLPLSKAYGLPTSTEEEKKIKEETKNKLAQNKNNYTLVYKNNNLVYENTVLKKDKVIYKYYDAYTYEYLDNITLEE